MQPALIIAGDLGDDEVIVYDSFFFCMRHEMFLAPEGGRGAVCEYYSTLFCASLSHGNVVKGAKHTIHHYQ